MGNLSGRVSTRGSTSTPVQVAIFQSSRVSAAIVGQLKLTGSVQQLTAGVLNNGVIFTAKSTNVAPIVIGGSSVTNTVDGTGNGYVLEAGASISGGLVDVSNAYVIGTSNDVISWMGS